MQVKTIEEVSTKLAKQFMLGFREAFSCPDVSPAKYETVMQHRITEAIKNFVSKENIVSALREIGVHRIGSVSDPIRWTVTDLGTDLSYELSK